MSDIHDIQFILRFDPEDESSYESVLDLVAESRVYLEEEKYQEVEDKMKTVRDEHFKKLHGGVQSRVHKGLTRIFAGEKDIGNYKEGLKEIEDATQQGNRTKDTQMLPENYRRSSETSENVGISEISEEDIKKILEEIEKKENR